jgi:hypothetical protein
VHEAAQQICTTKLLYMYTYVLQGSWIRYIADFQFHETGTAMYRNHNIGPRFVLQEGHSYVNHCLKCIMKSFKGAKDLQHEISGCLAGPPKTIQVIEQYIGDRAWGKMSENQNVRN